MAALAQLTTFVRSAHEDVLLKPWDMSVDLPSGSPTLPELKDGSNAGLKQEAQQVYAAMEKLGQVLSSRCAAVWLPDFWWHIKQAAGNYLGLQMICWSGNLLVSDL
jgi:hypothetical protein